MNNLKQYFSAILFLFLSSCCVTPVKHISPDEQVLLFPIGVYRHNVQVNINHIDREILINGVLSRKKEALSIVGLSLFNTTLFKLEENISDGDVSLIIYEDALKKYQKDFLKVYKIIGIALKSTLTELDDKNELQRFVDGNKVRVSFRDYENFFRTIEISHSFFTATIRVIDYEL